LGDPTLDDFFTPKTHFTQLPVSSLVQALSVFFAALTKKNKNVAKTSVSLGDEGLFQRAQKGGLYIRIDLEALVCRNSVLQKVNKRVFGVSENGSSQQPKALAQSVHSRLRLYWWPQGRLT